VEVTKLEDHVSLQRLDLARSAMSGLASISMAVNRTFYITGIQARYSERYAMAGPQPNEAAS
jgi:hypothetical protein